MPGYSVEHADSHDVPEIAAIFCECFKQSILFHCGKIPDIKAMVDVFSLVYEAEPQAAFVVRTKGKTVGYCFCPANLPAIWIHAVFGGHILKWGWRYISGRYSLGLYPIKMLFLNKLSFIKSAFEQKQKASARILSIAVLPGYQGQGYATKLMAAAIAYFNKKNVGKVRLEVRPDNYPAIKVYQKLGFKVTGSTFDPQGEWLIMFKEMGNNPNG